MAVNVDGNESWRVFRIMAEFVEGFETMEDLGLAVSIFGSARTGIRDPYYKAAEKTAKLLAEAGFGVITGGGPGIMEAANKGAMEAGGKSVGLNIALPMEQESNRYQTVSLDFHYFYARKVMFVKYACAFICFPGGYGTLDEFFETMELMQTLKSPAFPLILYGSKHWGGLVDWMKKALPGKFVNREDLEIFRVVDKPEDAVRLVQEGQVCHWWGPEDAKLRKIGEARGEKVCESPAVSGPMSGPMSGVAGAATGEGTRYGVRPRKVEKKHAEWKRGRRKNRGA